MISAHEPRFAEHLRPGLPDVLAFPFVIGHVAGVCVPRGEVAGGRLAPTGLVSQTHEKCSGDRPPAPACPPHVKPRVAYKAEVLPGVLPQRPQQFFGARVETTVAGAAQLAAQVAGEVVVVLEYFLDLVAQIADVDHWSVLRPGRFVHLSTTVEQCGAAVCAEYASRVHGHREAA